MMNSCEPAEDPLLQFDEDEVSSCELCALAAASAPSSHQPLQHHHGHTRRRGSRGQERIPQITIAAMQGRLEHVHHWIEHAGCDVNTVDFMGTMPLHRAALEGHVDIVEYLIQRGASLQTRVLDVKDTVLHLAASKGHAQVLKALLHAGAHIEARNADNYTPLLAAIRSNHLQCVQVLIANGASVSAPWIVDRREVGTCLHLAVQYGHLELTKFLLGVVALDVNQKTRRRHATPLHFAARHGHVEMAQYLVERHHADVRARDARGMTPLHYACDYEYHLTKPAEQHGVIERRHVEVVVWLLKSGSKVKPRRDGDRATPLRCAAMRGHLQIAKTLLDHGARSSKATKWLFALVWARDPFKVKFLVSSENGYSSNTGSGSSSNQSASSGSRKQRSKRTATSRDSLSSCGTQPDSPSNMTMLLENSTNTAANRILPSRFWDSSHGTTTNGGDRRTALHSACLNSDLRLLLELLGKNQPTSSDDNNTTTALEVRFLPEGLTALHIASRNGWLRGVSVLLKAGADVNALTLSNGATPLHIAAEHGRISVIKKLVAHGAKVNACDHAGTTPLLVALRNGRSYAMKLLLRHGATGQLCSLSTRGSISGMLSLGELFAYQAEEEEEKEEELARIFNPKRTTALHMAAFYGLLDTVRQLAICEGEDVDTRDQDGATPVWIAALMGHLDIVKFLAEQGANLNASAKNGASVALGAAEFGHLEVLAFLTAPKPELSVERLSLTRLSLQDHTSDRLSLTSMST